MLSDSLLTALGGVAGVLLFVVAIYIYASLLRQISTREFPPTIESTRRFGMPEASLALGLILLLLLNVLASLSGRSVELSSRILLENLLFTVAIVLFIVAFLAFRGFDLNSLCGFSRISFLRAASTGTVLLLAAYPLISLAETIAQRFLGGDSSRQNIIELFSGSSDRPANHDYRFCRGNRAGSRGIPFSIFSLRRAKTVLWPRFWNYQ